MKATAERRRFARRDQAVVMQITTERDHSIALSTQQVVTSNLSAGGVLFQTADWRLLPVGARVRFEIYVDQPLRCQDWHCSRLSGKGRVVRHDLKGVIDDGDWHGVAVTFDEPVTSR
jgi:hypothetical protein